MLVKKRDLSITVSNLLCVLWTFVLYTKQPSGHDEQGVSIKPPEQDPGAPPGHSAALLQRKTWIWQLHWPDEKIIPA